MFLIIAFLGGMISLLSPCTLPVIPLLFAGFQGQRRHILALLAGMIVMFTVVEARSSFNKVIFVPVNKDREAELAGQDHCLFIPVIKQDGGSVSPVVNFAILPLPFTIASLQIKGIFFQDVPVI
jgi:hypothetical protein